MSERITNTIRVLRKEATPAEQKFWQIVRNRNIDGHRFYRQHLIEFEIDGFRRFFIADFYCKECKLVIELDGGIHEQQKDYDAYRTYIIEQLGMRVVRFTNDDVRFSDDTVIDKLRTYLAE